MRAFVVASAIAIAMVSTQTVTLTIPTKAVVKAIVADPTSLVPVADQWKNLGDSVEYAWDLNANCYGERWYGNAGAEIARNVTCGGKTVSAKNGKCTTVNSAAKI